MPATSVQGSRGTCAAILSFHLPSLTLWGQEEVWSEASSSLPNHPTGSASLVMSRMLCPQFCPGPHICLSKHLCPTYHTACSPVAISSLANCLLDPSTWPSQFLKLLSTQPETTPHHGLPASGDNPWPMNRPSQKPLLPALLPGHPHLLSSQDWTTPVLIAPFLLLHPVPSMMTTLLKAT